MSKKVAAYLRKHKKIDVSAREIVVSRHPKGEGRFIAAILNFFLTIPSENISGSISVWLIPLKIKEQLRLKI